MCLGSISEQFHTTPKNSILKTTSNYNGNVAEAELEKKIGFKLVLWASSCPILLA